MSGASSDFSIGTNVELINTRSKFGGGTDTQLVESGVRITNGTTNSTGNITVDSMDLLKVRNTESRSGQIELNAQKGTIKLRHF